MNNEQLEKMSKSELIFHYSELVKQIEKTGKMVVHLKKRVRDIQLDQNIYHSSDMPVFLSRYLNDNLDKYISKEMKERTGKKAVELAKSWTRFSEN